MLEELRQYSSLGTVGYYWEVLGLFHDQPNADWSESSINSYFKGRLIDGSDIFDGGLPLLVASGVLEVDITGLYHITYGFRHRLHSQEHCRVKVLESILLAMKEDEATYAIFSTEYCSYDFVNNMIQVDRSAFGLQFSNIRDVLIRLDFLQPHPNYPERSYAVNRHHRNLFDKYLTEGIRKRRISPGQLRSTQAQQQENGLKGERFVYDYEIARTGRQDSVEWIAIYDTAAGFDIMSFETDNSDSHDRFIEVKAYSGSTPYFYWSRNEVSVAQSKMNQYFLYLVNLDEIDNPSYEPMIIQNPAIDVLDGEGWEKTVDKYHVVRIESPEGEH